MKQEPEPLDPNPWYIRLTWWAWVNITYWPWQVRDMKRAGLVRTGWRDWTWPGPP